MPSSELQDVFFFFPNGYRNKLFIQVHHIMSSASAIWIPLQIEHNKGSSLSLCPVKRPEAIIIQILHKHDIA